MIYRFHRMPKLITSQNAVEMAKRSWIARREQAERDAKVLTDAVARVIVSQPGLLDAPATSCETPSEEFAEARLLRVRKQLDLVDGELEAAVLDKDCPKGRIVELSTAQDRLQKQEQALAMRPSPGILKPSSRRSKPAAARPLLDDPAGLDNQSD